MDLRNNRFAAAFDELKRNHGIKTQKELARRMGVNENTITRILKGYTEVTEDVITKLQSASGCIFNLQWLRGEDETMLAKDVNEKPPAQSTTNVIDQSSMVNAIIATYEGRVADLKATLTEKDDHIATLKAQLKDKDARIADLERIISATRHTDLEKYPFPVGVADDKKARKNL